MMRWPCLLPALLLLATAPAAAAALVAVESVTAPLPLVPSADVAAWPSSSSATLAWDVQHARPATEPAAVHVATDGTYFYVRFDVPQNGPIAATQRTNNVGQDTDDEVWVDLWPQGANGYRYQFYATPNGTHYQSSSENSVYEPVWESQGTIRAKGYTVTMKIPFGIMHGAGSGTWKAQFVRYNRASGAQDVWSYDATQTSVDDLARAGSLQLKSSVASRPKPRLATYALGALDSPSIGGSTTRTGADLSIPVTPTSSLYATFHPDFSNVELDQQSISPSVFARYYNEVRPFFTQGSNVFNPFDCDACPGITELYTPAIPTPRDGYAVEGREGHYAFTALDALGVNRNDQATALHYKSTDLHWGAGFQRVAADYAGVHDDVTTGGIAYTDLKHLSGYFNYGSDAGTNVLRGSDAQRYDAGGGWSSSNFGFFASARRVGLYYNPVDGFIQHPGIAGYALYSNKIWTMAPSSKLAAVSFGGFLDRYTGTNGEGRNQSDNTLDLDVLTRSLVDVNLTTGSNYLLLRDTGVYTPVSQNGISLTLHSGSQTNNVGNFDQHGPSSTPTNISYNTGRYGDGRLDTWFRSTTMRAGQRGTITLELDNTSQWFHQGTANVQWFERFAYAYQLGPESSFAVGIRRVVGDPPVPNGGGNCVGVCSNVSVAYHARLRRMEIYAAYGDPNSLSTVPQFIFKTIFYAGADKGT